MDNFETAKQFFVQGLHLLEANDFESAEKPFTKSLELLPDRVSTLNNLSAIKNNLGKFTEAEALALKAVALEDTSPEGWSNLGFALARTERREEALLAFDRALQSQPAHPGAALNKADTLFQLKRYEEALRACDQALLQNPRQYEILYIKSVLLKELQRPDEARTAYLKSFEMRAATTPVLITPRRASQQAKVLVINRNPDFDISLTSFESFQFGRNFPGQLATYFKDDFHLTYVFEGDAAKPAAREQIPQPDVLINNNVNGELILSQGKLSELSMLVDSFGVPVVNHPDKAIHTTRDASAKLVEGIPGVLVPKIVRFETAGKEIVTLAQEIEEQFDYPFIVRSLALQQGREMIKADSREALIEKLVSLVPEGFFVVEFVPKNDAEKFYRKIRVMFVMDESIIVRVDYSPNWFVGARKSDNRVAFYLENAYLLEEEKKIGAHPEEKLGRSALHALEVIRDRIPLDVFGIDFDVDADGRLIFFEANATMNLFSTAQPSVPYPKEAEERSKQAFKRYILSLVARHS